MVIVISHIFTLWLKLGFHYFHYHSNIITAGLLQKKLETSQDSKMYRESKIRSKLRKLLKKQNFYFQFMKRWDSGGQKTLKWTKKTFYKIWGHFTRGSNLLKIINFQEQFY